jgi:serine/threonine protein kinase
MGKTSDDDLTHAAIDGDVAAMPAASGPLHAATPRDHRFEPGALIAGRYRVVALPGRGGMGEVYRAGRPHARSPVALKFLPPSAGAGRLDQFRTELKLARQVAHKNVCRVYDLGEAGGGPFLTMEYIDGEDLSSLLRRIGRIRTTRRWTSRDSSAPGSLRRTSAA